MSDVYFACSLDGSGLVRVQYARTVNPQSVKAGTVLARSDGRVVYEWHINTGQRAEKIRDVRMFPPWSIASLLDVPIEDRVARLVAQGRL